MHFACEGAPPGRLGVMRALLLAALLATTMAPTSVYAEEAELTPAERQLQLAQEDFAKGDYTRAIQA